jgi:SAM-dependent methyltransferase
MYLDVVDLRAFYAEHLGQVAAGLIGARLRKHWPSLKGERLLGMGYATPYLPALADGTERTIAFMPAVQGVVNWPPEGPNAAALVADDALPLPDAMIDRVLVIHSLEMSESPREQLREIWRVLAPGGRVLVVVPNRRGIWSRLERTPFGNGRPFTMGQLTRMLRDNMFTPVNRGSALFLPPTSSPMLLRTSPALERLGRRWFETFGGVVMIEAAKQIYAGAAGRESRSGRRAYLPMAQGMPRTIDGMRD